MALLRHFSWSTVTGGCPGRPGLHDGTYANLWIPSLLFVATVMFMLYKLALRADKHDHTSSPTS